MDRAVALTQVTLDMPLTERPRVVIVDMAVAADSPAGSCVLAEVQGLLAQFDVTVFSERLDAGDLPGVEFVRVRAPARPVLLRYMAFHFGVPIHYVWWRWRGGQADCVQATQGQLPGAAICYAHFCHAAYLKHQWRTSSVGGLRRVARLATHRFNAWCEAAAIRRARHVVVPSRGLARELAREYPNCAAKLHVIANPVAVENFARPLDFDREGQRARQGLEPSHLVLGFMALGDFERKGLGLLLQALAGLPATGRASIRLIVIGGQPGEIREFSDAADALGVTDAMHFVGMHADVRPWLWVCDVFAFPSAYETFGLAAMQAAAAGLPVMVCDGLHGIEEFIVDGHNGWSIARDPVAILAWLQRVLEERDQLPRLGRHAVESVKTCAPAAFQARWVGLVRALTGGTDGPAGVDCF